MPKFLSPIDLSGNEEQNIKFQRLASDPGSPEEGDRWYNTTTHLFKYYDGTSVIVLGKLNKVSAPDGDVSLAGFKITNLGTPSAGGDAATKSYVDGLTGAGVSWKSPVRAATTAAGTLATSFENGDVIDGVTLATGDRILIKDQATASENGIYVVAASGAPSRASDADTAAEMLGAAMFVEEGTTNADQAFVCTTNAPITLGTTGLAFVRFSGLGQVTAGAGLTKTGDTLDVVAASGSGIVVNADNIDIDPTNGLPVNRGGTGAITAGGAKTNLGFMTRYAADIGNGSLTSINVDHNLGTKDVHVAVYRNSDGVEVYADVTRSTTNRVVVAFATAPTSNQYRVVVIG